MVACVHSEIVAGALQDLDRVVEVVVLERTGTTTGWFAFGHTQSYYFSLLRHPEDAFKHWITLKETKW
jgi:hypothetical protein